MSFLDWFNVGGQVLDLAGSIAGLLGEEDKQGNDAPYDLGLLSFAMNDGKVYAINQSQDTNMLLNFCQVQQQGSATIATSKAVQCVAANGTDISTYVPEFKDGNFVINPLATGDADTLGQAVSFAVRTLAVGATINMIGGISASVQQTPSGWTFSATTTGPKIQGGSVTITDQNNMKINAKIKFKESANADDSGTYEADFPVGMALAPTITELDVDLVLDDSMLKFEIVTSVPLSEIPAFKHLKLR